MVTIVSKILLDTQDYVCVTLDTGEQFMVCATGDWLIEDPDTGKSPLAVELEQIPIRAQARLDQSANDAAAAQAILDSLG